MIVRQDNKKAQCGLAVEMKEDSTPPARVGCVWGKDSYTSAAWETLQKHLEQEDEGTGKVRKSRRIGSFTLAAGKSQTHASFSYSAIIADAAPPEAE